MPIDTGRSEVALIASSFTDANGSSVAVEPSNSAVEVFVREEKVGRLLCSQRGEAHNHWRPLPASSMTS